jgi:hypothetical protein
MSIREISRRTGLARNTVKKHLRSEESAPKYPRRVSSSKLDPYAEKLATWLVIEATKSRKQRRTLRQIHTDTTYEVLGSALLSDHVAIGATHINYSHYKLCFNACGTLDVVCQAVTPSSEVPQSDA